MTARRFCLGIDPGGSRISAAVWDAAGDTRARPVSLGRHADAAPASIFVSSGDIVFGDAAERRALAQPDLLVRRLLPRIGDDTPLAVADRRFAAEDLFVRLIGWAVQAAAVQEGDLPASIAVTVPAAWGPYRTALVGEALERHGLGDAALVAGPVAVARHHLRHDRIHAGSLVGVYDFGGSSFTAALVRTGESDVAIEGTPMSIDDLGGIDVDDRMMEFALRRAGLTGLDSGALERDAGERVALAALRRECTDAKEALSSDSESIIPVLVAGRCTTVRVTREDLEAMIDAHLARTIDLMLDVLDGAGVEPDGVDAILLTGGSSRIPRVAQLVSERVRRPIIVDGSPKIAAAAGAAQAAADGSYEIPGTRDGEPGAVEPLMPQPAAAPRHAHPMKDLVGRLLPFLSPSARGSA